MPFSTFFASPRWPPLRMRTKVVSFFIFFQDLSNKKKIKKLGPKMTKIASRGPALKTLSCKLHQTISSSSRVLLTPLPEIRVHLCYNQPILMMCSLSQTFVKKISAFLTLLRLFDLYPRHGSWGKTDTSTRRFNPGLTISGEQLQ